METATLGAGCFWGVEARFGQLPGVIETAVGYEGGDLADPSYKDVCTDRTGHAEVVQVKFDPDKVSYSRLLDLFFALHDPTQLNRQGPDWGTQYRSVVFIHSPEQESAVRQTIDRLTRGKSVFQADCDSGCARRKVLARRRVSPEIFGETRGGFLSYRVRCYVRGARDFKLGVQPSYSISPT